MKKYVDMQMSARMSGGDVGMVVVEGVIVSNDPFEFGYTTPPKLRNALDGVMHAKRLNIHINSPGGNVHQGMAMRSLLINHPAEEKHVYIEGECSSSATLLACIGAKVHMNKGSLYMIHCPSVGAWGTADDHDHCSAYLRKTEKEVSEIYAQRTGSDAEAMLTLMKGETYMYADEAVSRGFADDVIDIDVRMCAVHYTYDDVMMLGYKNAHLIDRPDMKTEPVAKARDEPGAPADQNENVNQQEGAEGMEITDITMEMLKEGNPTVFSQIIKEGAQMGIAQERARLKGLDDITMEGCEDMVYAAKYEEGKMCEPGELAVRMIKDGAGKGAAFMAARREASKSAQQVAAQGTPDETKMTDEQLAQVLGEEVAAMVN